MGGVERSKQTKKEWKELRQDVCAALWLQEF